MLPSGRVPGEICPSSQGQCFAGTKPGQRSCSVWPLILFSPGVFACVFCCGCDAVLLPTLAAIDPTVATALVADLGDATEIESCRFTGLLASVLPLRRALGIDNGGSLLKKPRLSASGSFATVAPLCY